MGTGRDTPERRIAEIAARQHGVVCRAQLLDAGVSPKGIVGRCRRGLLHPVHRNVFAVGHPHLAAEGRWLAGVLALGRGAVLSHLSAAALWGIRPSASPWIHVTVPTAGGRRRRAGMTVHRSRAAVQSTVCDAIPVTTPGRTLLDLADLLPWEQVERAIERAEVLRLEARPPVLPGRRTLPLVEEPAFVFSELERRFVRLCGSHGVPPPRVNAFVEGLMVDFSWPHARLVVEVDGFRHHGTRGAFERDRARDARLVAAGHRVMRFTFLAVARDPAGTADLVLRALLRSRV